MLATWIEAAAKGRHGGRSGRGCGRRSSSARTRSRPTRRSGSNSRPTTSPLGPLPAFWIENKGVNSLWHVPIPPAGGRRPAPLPGRRPGPGRAGLQPVPGHDRPAQPARPDRVARDRRRRARGARRQPDDDGPGRRRGARPYDVYFPTVGLHSDVRPAEGDLPQSRSHFRAIVGGLAIGRRLDWFTERLGLGGLPALPGGHEPPDDRADLAERADPRAGRPTSSRWATACPGPPAGPSRPASTSSGSGSSTTGPKPTAAVFGVYVQAEVNGGIGEPGLSWHDGDRTLLAINRGHGHVNRKLARDATVEFAVALDGRGEVQCEPTGAQRGDPAPQARPARRRARSRSTCSSAGPSPAGGATPAPSSTGSARPGLVPLGRPRRGRAGHGAASGTPSSSPCPSPHFPKPTYAVSLRRSALAAALHADEQWGAIASGFDRGLSAYCWPREAIWVGAALRPARPSRDRPRGLPVARHRSRGRPGPMPTGSRNTPSTASPSGRPRRSTRPP